MTELERTLLALGRELDVPEAPDFAATIRQRLEPHARLDRPRGRPGGGLGRRLARRRVAVVALALLAALAATLAVPDARSALFRVLHIGGERIEFVGDLPEVEAPAGLDAVLGERVSLAEARRRAGFGLRELEDPPDRVYLQGVRPTVWFLYGTPDRVRLLVAQTPGVDVEPELILKKLVTDETTFEEVSVGGLPGVYLSGEPHLVLLFDEFGNVVEESARLAGDVLVWETNGVAIRLEGDFSKDEALRIAESLR